MAKREAIRIDYPGDCISVNHYLGRRKDGGYYVKEDAKNWMTEFQWLLKRLHLETWQLPLEVTCSGYFKDERSAPDLSNLSKVIMDSIEELIGINDSNFRWHDGTRNIGCKETYLLITISEVLAKPLPQSTQSKSSGIEGKSSSLGRVKRKYAKKTTKKS